jgi:hypothetical protein
VREKSSANTRNLKNTFAEEYSAAKANGKSHWQKQSHSLLLFLRLPPHVISPLFLLNRSLRCSRDALPSSQSK